MINILKESVKWFLGIGSDILNISRLDKILLKHNKKFILRFYGKKEIEIINKKAKNLNCLGKDLQ